MTSGGKIGNWFPGCDLVEDYVFIEVSVSLTLSGLEYEMSWSQFKYLVSASGTFLGRHEGWKLWEVGPSWRKEATGGVPQMSYLDYGPFFLCFLLVF